MPHIHNQPGEHDNTVSAYIVRTDFDEPKLLLHKHKILGKWMQSGGHVELKDNPWQAMISEVLQETGYTIDTLQILQPRERLKHITGAVLHPQPIAHITHPFPKLDHKHTDLSYGFVTTQEPTQAVAANESDEFMLVTYRELQDIDTFDSVRQIANFLFEVALKNWERVPTDQFEA